MSTCPLQLRLAQARTRARVATTQATMLGKMIRAVAAFRAGIVAEFDLDGLASVATRRYAEAVVINRVIVVMYRRHTDMSYPEIAEAMGLPASNQSTMQERHAAGLECPKVMGWVERIEAKYMAGVGVEAEPSNPLKVSA